MGGRGRVSEPMRPATGARPGLPGSKGRVMMDGMRWMMDGMGLIGFLVLVVLILAAAALVKYLLASRK